MKSRTLVKLYAEKYCVGFRTISRSGKSPMKFLISRNNLEKLEREQVVIANDIRSFAILRRNIPAGLLYIDFTWLHSNDGTRVAGRTEMISKPLTPER